MTAKKSVTHKAVTGKSTPDEIMNGADEPVATITDAAIDADPHMGQFTHEKLVAVAEDDSSSAQEIAQKRLEKERSVPTLEPDAHADQRMAHIKERAGHAVAVINVPAHQEEVSLGFSSIPGCALAAAEAWDSIDKAPDDASFVLSTGYWRKHLISVAEDVYKSGVTTQGNTTISKFERAVLKIKARQDEQQRAAENAA